MSKSAVGIPHKIKAKIRTWKSSKPTLLEPKPRWSQKNIGGNAKTRNVGRLKIPRTVIVAKIKQ